MKLFESIAKRVVSFRFASAIMLGATVGITGCGNGGDGMPNLPGLGDIFGGGGGGGGGGLPSIPGYIAPPIVSIPYLPNLTKNCSEIATIFVDAVFMGLPTAGLLFTTPSCIASSLKSEILSITLSKMPKYKGVPFDVVLDYNRLLFNQPIGQVIEPQLLDFLNSATVPDSPLNQQIYRNYYQTLLLGQSGTPIVSSPVQRNQGPQDDPNMQSYASSGSTSSAAVRGQIGFTFPFQVQVIGWTNGLPNPPSPPPPPPDSIPTSASASPLVSPPSPPPAPPVDQPPSDPLGITWQVRFGFPFYMTNKIIGDQASIVSSKSWEIENNKGFFYTTIAVELGTKSWAVKAFNTKWNIPTFALEANLLLKCSVNSKNCQIQNMAVQGNIDKSFKLISDLIHFMKMAGVIKEVTQSVALTVDPIAGLSGNVGEPLQIVGKNVGATEDIFDNETAVSGRNLLIYRDMIPIITEGAMDTIQLIASELPDVTLSSMAVVATPAAVGLSPENFVAGEDTFETAGEEIVSAMPAAEETIEQIMITYVNQADPQVIPGQGAFWERNLFEIQFGTVWLNPDAYKNNNPGYKVHSNSSPDIFKFGSLMAWGIGLERGNSTKDNSGVTFRARLFPNATVLSIIPFTSVGRDVLPWYTSD